MDFLVKRDDLHQCRVAAAAPVELQSGQALLAISAFGLTANNVTYGVFGEAMSYWNFFPADDGWGRIPMWGFADVAATAHEGLEEGTRVFGYLPPSEQLVVAPDRVDSRGFRDASPHRLKMASAYNRYVRVDTDPLYEAGHEDQQMLLQPLFVTAFFIDDFLDENQQFGATAVLLSSASSKTALATAFLLARRGGVEVIGLTSPKNVSFVEGVGVYDRVLPYGELPALEASPSVYVDMSGDAGLRSAVHHHLVDALRHSSAVGATHWSRMTGTGEVLPGPQPTVFFAPDRSSKRARDWGVEGLNRRIGDAWRPYVEWTTHWLEVVHGRGTGEVERVYRELLEGKTDPSVGHVLSMAPRGR